MASELALYREWASAFGVFSDACMGKRAPEASHLAKCELALEWYDDVHRCLNKAEKRTYSTCEEKIAHFRVAAYHALVASGKVRG